MRWPVPRPRAVQRVHTSRYPLGEAARVPSLRSLFLSRFSENPFTYFLLTVVDVLLCVFIEVVAIVTIKASGQRPFQIFSLSFLTLETIAFRAETFQGKASTTFSQGFPCLSKGLASFQWREWETFYTTAPKPFVSNNQSPHFEEKR